MVLYSAIEVSNLMFGFPQELDDERKAHATLQVKLSQVVTHNQDLEVRATNKDYRINNYDRVNQ